MSNRKMTLAVLIATAVIWFQPSIQLGANAQQAPAATNAIDELNSRRSAIESMTDIDATVKADSLNFIDEAIAYAELGNASQRKLDDLLQLVKTAPDRLKSLQSELKRPVELPDNIGRRAQQMSTLKLEQRVRQKEAELAAAQNTQQEWSDRLAEETAAINQIPEQAAIATTRLNEIETALQGLAGTPDTDVLNHSNMLSLQAEQKRWIAENNLVEQRQQIQNLMIELFTAQRDVSRKTVEGRQEILKLWQAELQKRRNQEAVQAREEAQDAITEVPLLPKAIQDEFNQNIELSAELERATREEARLTLRYDDDQLRLEDLDQEFETAKKRIGSAVVTETIGMALRSQRVTLPSVDKYKEDAFNRKIRMSEISERQIALDVLAREIADPKAFQEKIGESISSLPDIDREALDDRIQGLMAARQDLVQRLNISYNRMFKLIQDIEFTEQQIANTADSFGEFLDRHLLWIRSSEPVSLAYLPLLKLLGRDRIAS